MKLNFRRPQTLKNLIQPHLIWCFLLSINLGRQVVWNKVNVNLFDMETHFVKKYLSRESS